MLSLLGPYDGGFLFAHLFLRQLAAVRAGLVNSLAARDYLALAEEADQILLATHTFDMHALATNPPATSPPAVGSFTDGRDRYATAPREEPLLLPSAFWCQGASLSATFLFFGPGKRTRQAAVAAADVRRCFLVDSGSQKSLPSPAATNRLAASHSLLQLMVLPSHCLEKGW